MSEFGVTVPQGADRLRKALPDILEDADYLLPGLAREIMADLRAQLNEADQRIKGYDQRIRQLANTMPQAKRLMAVDGVGPLIATALIATAGDARLFDNGRQFAAWLGHGARSVLCRLNGTTDSKSQWATKVKERRGFNKALVALAAKHARILWAMLAHEADYLPVAK